MLSISLLLAGCATTKLVKVPIPIQCPVPQIPEKVLLPIKNLSDKSTAQEVGKAYIESIQLLIIDDLDLRQRLSVYLN
jgi:hypothetical protein